MTIARDDAEEFSEATAQVGQGWFRQVAWAFRQGIPEALDMTPQEWKARYYGDIQLPTKPRKEAVAELTEQGMSAPEIAAVLGVNEKTVDRDRNPPGTNVPEEQSDSEETTNPPGTNVPEDFGVEPAIEHGVNLLPTLDEPTMVPVNEGDEWYTPRWLFDALGIKFQIDVCAPSDRTYSSVPAERHFTIEDDGLAQPWDGTVWCNPPYSKPEPWARRMIHHGDGLLLTHIPMNAGWCVDAWETCDAIRLFQAMEFVRPDGTSQRPGYWLQLAAFGPTATEALGRLQPLGAAAFNKRRVASPMWTRAS